MLALGVARFGIGYATRPTRARESLVHCHSERSEESSSRVMCGYTKRKILRCAQDDKTAVFFIDYLKLYPGLGAGIMGKNIDKYIENVTQGV